MSDAIFLIDDTDFQIDTDESSFDVDLSDPGNPLLTIEIRGKQCVHDQISEDDASPWSWALYAPHFYLREFPAKPTTDKSQYLATATLDDIDDYELAIYMMEHSDIDDVQISVQPNKSLDITGRVDLFGNEHTFAIRWQK
ncbi:MAG: hypothetical protein HKN47_06765 [Pirellulaceae bacterium]|nr:hypothetical protein [Pirellulaceae bacterium]